MAVIISDFLGPINWMRPLRAIAGRHEVLGIEVLDPRDVELPPVGERPSCRTTESGVTREFTIDEQLRSDFEKAATAHRAEVARTLRSLRCAPAVAAHGPGLDRRRCPLRPPAVGAGRWPDVSTQTEMTTST